jgi:hypothetical protein
MRIVSLIFIAIITFVIVLVVKRPELFKNFWLWLIGLSGLVLHVLQVIWNYVKEVFSKAFESEIKKKKEVTVKMQTKKE